MTHTQSFIRNSSFNNYSDKHFWKMIYNILIKILQYIHSNYERYMMNKLSTNFQYIMHHKLSTNFQQTFNTSCITNFQQTFNKLSIHHASQTFNKSFADLSQQIEWQIFHHIIHHDKLVTTSTHHSSYLHHNNYSDRYFTTFFNTSFIISSFQPYRNKHFNKHFIHLWNVLKQHSSQQYFHNNFIHNFNTTSTQLQHNTYFISAFISTFVLTFISYFIQQSMKQFFNTFSSHTFTILPQQTIQDLVTKLSFTIYDAILYHNNWVTNFHSQHSSNSSHKLSNIHFTTNSHLL